MHPVFRPSNIELFFRRNIARKTLRDVYNRRRFGTDGPLSDEALFIDPCAVKWQFKPGRKNGAPRYSQIHSGLVVGGDWDLSVSDITKSRKFIACHAHFVDGQTWKDTGIYDHMMTQIGKYGSFDACYTMDDVIVRYAAIDQLYDDMATRDRMMLRRELPEFYRRESGGILGHINRHGEVIRYANGNHRFLVARILKYREVPIHVGAVHLGAVTSGAFAALRQSIYD